MASSLPVKFMLLVFILMLSSIQSHDTGAEQPAAEVDLDDYNWAPEMVRYVHDCNFYGNTIVWRVGNLWNTFDYDTTYMKPCNTITLHGVGFEGVSFNGYGHFRTTGWYGWQNWAFTGTWNRVDTQTVEFF